MNKLRFVVIGIIMACFILLPVARADPLPDPIVIVYNSGYSSNPFGLYLGEILRAEGLNAYSTFDLFGKTGSQLAAELDLHELALLAETNLAADQATALSNYVAGGGRLIAMRPDAQIKGLFGLGTASGNLINGYVKIQTTANWNGKTPGAGLSSQPLQIHGLADQYTLNTGAVMIAELYSNSGTPTGYPAVIGSASGKTAAFTYDLAANVVYTRQGNPSNANIDVDGDGTIRTTDLFMGSLGGNPWVDRDLIPVPQADEQQRLLVRLLKQAIENVKPFPQLWYFPDTTKTALILTGDSHANPTEYFQYEINSLNAHQGKITFYLSLAGPDVTSFQNWRSQGHEFGVHPYKSVEGCTNFTECYPLFKNWFVSTYISDPSRTVRNHQVAWEGWTTAAEIAANNGFNLDLNFYHWGAWLQKPDGTWPHGYITGSGQPMKFIRQDGTIINNYQLLTELVDEQLLTGAGSGFEQLTSELASLVSYKLIDSSLINDYAALMTQFHVDYYSTTYLWAENTLDFARTRGVAVSNADTFLAFTEARNAAKFSDIAWNSTSNTLTFQLTAPTAPSYYLTVILPLNYNSRTLTSVSVDSTPVNFSIHTIKGEAVAFVSVPSGNHTFLAAYQSDSGILTHTTYADFTPVCATSNGVFPFDQRDSLILSGQLHDYFDGASLDGSRWSSGSWSGGSYTPVVSGGLLTLPGGGWVRSLGTYTRAIVDATAQFGNGAWQHIGFAYDGFAQDRYIIFSTFAGDGNLYARVNNQTVEQNINLGPIPSGFHRYRVVWEAVDGLNDRATFYIDGALQAQFTFAKAGNENLYLYLSNNGSADLVIDYAQVSPPYTASGTFTSCALDAGLGKEWTAISWDAFAGEGNLTVEARTSLNGSTWTGWSTITSNGGEPAVKNRYIQYRLTLSTAYPNYTPEVNSVSLLYESSVPPADISVSKTDNQTTVVAGGGPQTYTIVVSNAGPANATDVTLTDTWPAAFTRGTVTTTQGTCSGSPSFTCNLGTLIAGNSATITVAYTVPANTPAGDVTNAVSVSTSSIDPDSNNNNASDTNTVVRSINLGVSKSDGVTSVTAGDGVQRTYTITVNNAGPSDASGVILSDTWPAAFTRGAVTPSQGTCSGSSNFTCSLGVLASGGSATVTVSYTVPPSAPAGSATNSVSVSANETDSNPANNSASDTNTVVRSINLGVSKSDGVASVTAGDGVQRSYTITVNNAGPSDASGVTLTDTWPTAFTRGAVTPSQGTCSGSSNFTCSLGVLASGGSATVTVSYTVPPSAPAGSATNSVSVSANETDSNPANNSANDTNTVVRSINLGVSKSDGVTSVTAGDGVQRTYTITVNNAGPSDASGVTLSDTWPSAFTRGAVTPSQGTCSGSSNFTCSLGVLASGGSATVTVSYTVPPSAPAGSATNSVSVSANETDSNPANNSASDTNTVVRSINLGVAKSDGATSVTAGDGVQRSYTITVNNAGPSDASGVTLSDTWPSAFTRGAVTPSQGTCSGSSNFTCSLGVLASGGSATVTVSYTVPPSAPAGSATNTASVTATETDSNPANNSASDTNTVVRSINLGVAKSDGVASVTAGDGVQRTYTITVNNAGPSDASTVILTDTWPSAFTRGTVSASQGNCSGYPDFTCSLQTIAAGASATITVNYTVPANTPAGSATNSVSVSANETDSDPQDNSATDSTLVITSADLSLTKAASSSILQVGSTLVFTVTVSNEGPSVANGVVVQDILPSGYTFVQAETTRGGYSNTTGLWTIGAISPGESLTLRLELVIKSTGEFDNYAQVYASSTPDPDSTPGNDSQTEDDDAFVFMGTFADLSLSMTASKTASFVGDQLIFTLVLVNSGPSPALQVQVKDILPSGYTLLNSSATLGAYSSLDGIWTVGNLNAGSTAVLNLVVKVNAAPGQYLNQAEVWSTDTLDPDSIPGNSSMIEDDEASVDVTVNFIFLPVVAREP